MKIKHSIPVEQSAGLIGTCNVLSRRVLAALFPCCPWTWSVHVLCVVNQKLPATLAETLPSSGRRYIPLYTANVRIGHRTCLHMSNFELLEVSVILYIEALSTDTSVLSSFLHTQNWARVRVLNSVR